jgi:hypothetical protein
VKVLIAACLLTGFIVVPANADIIYFKDGMKTICQERTWEENGEVKCEYAGWIITYQKTDILRIVKTTRPKTSATTNGTAPDKQTTRPKTSATTNRTAPDKQTTQPAKKPLATQSTAAGSITKKIKTGPNQAIGPAFYDPRRSYKYWAGQNSKHKTYTEAIQALAKKYHSTPQLVQAHMGDSNDLDQIHRNLAKPEPKQVSPKAQPTAGTAPEMLFYNPRRPYPYWTSKQSKHKSYKEAIQALAKQYDRAPDWIKLNMGATNDLNKIHQNLVERKAADSAG